MLLFYVRHGHPTYDPDALTPIGRRQAEAAARRLAGFGLDKIFVSSSARARQTAEPAAELCGLEPVVLDWCNEHHAWQEMSVDDGGVRKWCFATDYFAEKFVSPAIAALGGKWYDSPEFAGRKFREGILRVERETDAFLETLGYRHDRGRNLFLPVKPTGERVALFAHEGFGKMFMSAVLDIPYPQVATRLEMSYTGVSVIEFAVRPGGFVIPEILTYANDSHLYRDGLPLHYQHRLRF